jgi:hypothetical protein
MRRLPTLSSFARITSIVATLGAAIAASACANSRTREEGGEIPSADVAQDHAQPAATPLDWKAVESAMGRSGAMQPGDVYKFAFPRGDLHVTAAGVSIKPALALGGWVAFKQDGANDAVATGDLVLAEGEVGPVMTKLQAGGIEQTALHNHLLHESPHVLYMHIHAHGDPVKVAATIQSALAGTATPPAATAAAAAAPPSSGLDTAAIHAALGQTGKLNGVVYQVSVPRAEVIHDGSVEIPPAMGVATAINFQSTGPNTAAATGDFVLIGDEVNPVIQALTSNGIEVTALHSHMLAESPRLFFMHFWGNADQAALARGLRAALDKMNIKRS